MAFRVTDKIKEALKIQRQYMTVAQDRHRAWSKESGDPEINRIRSEIIDLIEKTLVQYDNLLEALRRPIEGD